ncbi:MAG: TRAP transporter large permease [Rhizobiales bacterium]|nr:TRAP transporter large permease [Hyphomicrobiales bacterium]
MSLTLIFTTVFVFLLALGLPVAAVIIIIGLMTEWVSPVSFLASLGPTAWTQSQSYLLVSIPLFILFGEILVRSGIAGNMYGAITPWLNRVPGKLMQTNIATSAIFAATSGSSVATAATVASVAIPEIRKGGYNERLFLGSIAAGGTLGILIPPSINMIVYGALTNTSIPQLYLAGFVPGILLMLLFMLVAGICCLFRPDWDGQAVKATWKDRLRSLPALLPPIMIFLVVVGSIYAGIATPTEAAALGVLASVLLAAAHRKMTISLLNESILATMRTTSMLILIMIAASFLNFAIGFMGFTKAVEDAIVNSNLGPYTVIAWIIVAYLVLGCFLDGLSMTVLTVPILAPAIVKLGFDPIWFGIIVILSTEMGLLTPPVGMNCYVVQGVRGRGSITDVFVGVAPYAAVLMLFIVMLIVFPQIALWLPDLLK